MLGKKGLVSVTFRALSPREIVRLAASCGLETVEWGADVHVPPADLQNARAVGEDTRRAGLEVVSYGSYYALGRDENPSTVGAMLNAAEALGARNLRVWAGFGSSRDTLPAQFDRVVSEAWLLADACQRRGMTLSFEYHQNTLTDCRESAVRLLTAIGHPNCFTYWQPVQTLSTDENLRNLRAVLLWLTAVHVFQWSANADGSPDRRPLAEGADEWSQYLDLLRGARSHPLQLEFVRGDSPDALREDADALLSWK